jgi:hypothetical protein
MQPDEMMGIIQVRHVLLNPQASPRAVYTVQREARHGCPSRLSTFRGMSRDTEAAAVAVLMTSCPSKLAFSFRLLGR